MSENEISFSGSAGAGGLDSARSGGLDSARSAGAESLSRNCWDTTSPPASNTQDRTRAENTISKLGLPSSDQLLGRTEAGASAGGACGGSSGGGGSSGSSETATHPHTEPHPSPVDSSQFPKTDGVRDSVRNSNSGRKHSSHEQSESEPQWMNPDWSGWSDKRKL